MAKEGNYFRVVEIMTQTAERETYARKVFISNSECASVLRLLRAY